MSFIAANSAQALHRRARGRKGRTCARTSARGVLYEGCKEYDDVMTFLRKLNHCKRASPSSVLCASSTEMKRRSVSHCIAVQDAVISAVSSTLCCFVSKVGLISDGNASSGTPCTRSSLRKPRRNALTSSSFAKISFVHTVSFFSRGKTVQNSSCKSLLYVQVLQYLLGNSRKSL